MENLAYISLIAAYEDLDNNKPVILPLVGHSVPEANWRMFSVQTLLRLLSLGLFVAILGLFNSALALIKLGDRGSQVAQLQQALQTLGYFNERVTGYYGSLTTEAVIGFQRDNLLTADGVVGPETELALQRQLFRPTSQPFNQVSRRYLQPGDRGLQVRKLQERLIIAGYPNVTVDGIYGSGTQEAVRLFQIGYGLLDNNGIADPDTQQVLQRKFYVVVVPARNEATLNLVRQIDNKAYLASNRLGDYIHVGAYLDLPGVIRALGVAKNRVKELRRRGLKDARVAYL